MRYGLYRRTSVHLLVAFDKLSHSPFLYLKWMALIYSSIYCIKQLYCFCWSPGSGFLKIVMVPVSTVVVLSLGSVLVSIRWVGGERTAGVLQVFPPANPHPDFFLNYFSRSVWCTCLRTSTSCVHVAFTTAIQRFVPGAVWRRFKRSPHSFKRTVGNESVYLNVAIKYVLRWPYELVNLLLKQNTHKAINQQCT